MRRRLEGRRIADDVIGGRHHEDGAGIRRLRLERRERDRGRRIAADRLQEDRRGGTAERAQLFGDRKAVRLVADNDRCPGARDAGESQGRVLQHRVFAGQGQELFRIHLTRKRPEARSRPARQNHRYDCRHQFLTCFAYRARSHNN